MSKMIKCDTCGNTVPVSAAVGWFVLDMFGISVSVMGDAVLPVHFCSLECITKYNPRKAKS